MSHSQTGDEKKQGIFNEQPDSENTSMLGTGNSPRRRAPKTSTLRYRHRALWLLALYIPILVIPWALTGVLAYHPVDLSSYLNQYGFTARSLSTQRYIINAISVLNSFTSIVTIPIVSALIAQATVVYTQRRHRNQKVSIRQAFALADRGWSNLSILGEAWPPWKVTVVGHENRTEWRGPGSGFLWLATLFLLVCGIQQPIREGFVSNEQTLVMTTNDNPVLSEYYRGRSIPVGFDPEPDDMSAIPEGVVVQQLTHSLASLSMGDVPTHLWPDLGVNPFKLYRHAILQEQLGPWAQPPQQYFAAAFPNGTTTGVLRHRAMRLNSTVECTEIEQSSFPSTCDGQNPFDVAFGSPDQLGVRICVPGQRGKFPWELSRNRQDITEDIFVDVDTANATESYTRHCTVQSTRGYFELGNYRNKYIHGPLLARWIEPDPLAEKSEFNDYLSDLWRDNNTFGEYTRIFSGQWRRPSEEDRVTDIPGWPINIQARRDWSVSPGFNSTNATMSGPLMTSAIAMFGHNSLFAAASSSTDTTTPSVLAQICQDGRLPFTAFNKYRDYTAICESQESDDEKLLGIIKTFVDLLFSERADTVRYLSASVHHANEAMLVQTARKTEAYTARPLYTAPGEYIPKPEVSFAGLVLISVLVLLQMVGLLYLTWYIYQVPTWTAMLDALAVARITNSLDKDNIPAIGSMSSKDLQRLESIDALVGVVETGAEDRSSELSPAAEGKSVELGLGASGLFSRRLTKFRVQRSAELGMDCQCEGCRRRRDRVDSSTWGSSYHENAQSASNR